jgi:hypothetical protein
MSRGQPGVSNPKKAYKQPKEHPWRYQQTKNKFYSQRNKEKFDESKC